jgi:hypothetical protein
MDCSCASDNGPRKRVSDGKTTAPWVFLHALALQMLAKLDEAWAAGGSSVHQFTLV